MNCPHCGKRVSDFATSCPHCKKNLNEAPNVVKDDKGAISNKKNISTKIVVAIVVGAALLICSGVFFIRAYKISSAMQYLNRNEYGLAYTSIREIPFSNDSTEEILRIAEAGKFYETFLRHEKNKLSQGSVYREEGFYNLVRGLYYAKKWKGDIKDDSFESYYDELIELYYNELQDSYGLLRIEIDVIKMYNDTDFSKDAIIEWLYNR